MTTNTLPAYADRHITAIEAADSLEFLRAVFACYEANRLFAITRPDVDPTSYGAEVTYVSHGGETRGWGQLALAPSTAAAPAQIVFSSGTEGRPKAILLSHANLADVVTRLNDIMQVTSEIREYVGVPVTYSFGLGRIRAVSAAGGQFFLPERFDPNEIVRMLRAGEINAISAVPSLWRLILSAPQILGDAGAQVRWIEIGSQYMSAAEKAQMRDLFPNARIVQHYGMTEASRSTFLVISDVTNPEILESVGPAHNVQLTEDGAVRIRGAHVALGLLEPRGALVPLTDEAGWLTSGDRGAIRDGYLYFLGRLDDQMNLGGIKLGAEALEMRIAEIVPGAKGHIGVTSVPDEMRGEVMLMAVEPPATSLLSVIEAAARQALSDKGVQPGGSLRVQTVDSLPRTATGKIQRAALRQLADLSKSGPVSAPAEEAARDLTEGEARIAALWTRVLGPVPLNPASSFYEMGGDSLSGLQAGLILEEAGLSRAIVNATLEGHSLSDVAALLELAPETIGAENDSNKASLFGTDAGASTASVGGLGPRAQLSWALTVTRAVVVLTVLLSHWGPGLFNALSFVPEALSAHMWPIYRTGTPGFAFAFGIGIGLYALPDLAARPEAVYHRLRRAFWLVFAGIVIEAVFVLTRVYLEGRPLNGLWISNAFYGVLTYYAIMLASARLWLPAVARLPHPMTLMPLIGLGLWALWPLAESLITPEQQVSLIELPRLMLVAGYSVFKLSALALCGIAVGLWISRQTDMAQVVQRTLTLGLVGAVFSMAVLLQFHGPDFLTRNSYLYVSLPGLTFYACIVLVLLGGFLHIMARWRRKTGLWAVLLRLAMVFGGLALPIYAFHQIVLPARDSLVLLGMGGALALALPMGVFWAVMIYLGRRVWRMYG